MTSAKAEESHFRLWTTSEFAKMTTKEERKEDEEKENKEKQERRKKREERKTKERLYSMAWNKRN